ncbi:MAG: right-handed parallel beta-helix repeat-containing protein, partial [Deltaproteobacteria bacterium]
PRVELTGNRVSVAGAMGIKILGSHATLSNDRVSGARADPRGLEGDGLYLFDSVVVARGERIEGSGGDGVAVLGGRASLSGCAILSSADAAAFVDEHGSLTLNGCHLRGASLGLHVEPGSRGSAPGTEFQDIRGVLPGIDAGPGR